MPKNGRPSKRSGNGRKSEPFDIDRVLDDGTAIDRAVRQATREAVLRHKRLGESIVVWRNGRVVWLKPNEIK